MLGVCIGLCCTTTNHEEQRLEKVQEHLYTELCARFKDTYVEEVYNMINKRFKIGRVRFLMKRKNMFVLAWDPEMRLHDYNYKSKGAYYGD